MKKNIFTVFSVIFVGLVIFIYLKNKSSTDVSSAKTQIAIDEMGDPADGERSPLEGSGKVDDTEVFPDEPSHEAAGFLPTSAENPDAFQKYRATFKEMATCLNMQINEFTADRQMSFETFHHVINPDLGDIVSTSDEWKATDIRTASGETRRIYIEYGPDIDGPPKRTLKYYTIAANGTQKDLPLSSEQMFNPTDTLIVSLESDGKVVGQSTSRKIFYQNGDDLLLVERDGKVLSFELPHDGATFSCNNFDNSGKMTCKCQ